MKKIAVVGSRTFDDYNLLERTLDELPPFILISGGAKGTDALAERYCADRSYDKIIYLPDKKKYGRGAYHRRNELIVQEADEVIAFWDCQSKGTANTIGHARKNGVPVRVINVEEKGE